MGRLWPQVGNLAGSRLKIGVIIDGTKVSRWQAEALSTLACEAEFVVYSCISPAPAHRRLRHGLYYLLNLVTIRNPQTRRIELPSTLRVVAWRTSPRPLKNAGSRCLGNCLRQLRTIVRR